MSDSRAEMIARTEAAYAAANGDIAGFRETGVEYVEISDGTDFDEECALADGQVWTLDEYEANDLEHPNCGRSASAISNGRSFIPSPPRARPAIRRAGRSAPVPTTGKG